MPPTTPVPFPRSGHALPPCFAPNLRVRFTHTIFEFDDFWSYRPQNKSIWSKIDEEADFDVHSGVGPPKPHQIDENLIFRSKNFAFFFFRRRKIESCKSSETRVAEVSRRSEPSSRGERTFEVRRRRCPSENLGVALLRSAILNLND